MFLSFRSKYLWLAIFLFIVLLAGYTAWRMFLLVESSNSLEETGVTDEVSTQKEEVEEESVPTTYENTETTDTAADASDSQATQKTGDGNDDFGACDADAQTYCSGFYSGDWQTYAADNGYTTASWKYGLLDCLAAHRDQTSQACDDSLDRRQVLNDEMNAACRTDRRTYCPGIEPKPGSEPEVDCLKEHYDQLSDACVEALDAHEAAKPTAE